MKTSRDYTVDFKHYGLITIPAGTLLTHKTALGVDPAYHFVNSTNWIDKNYAHIANILRHDVVYTGINVPKEYVDYEIEPIIETKSVSDLNNYYESQLEKIGNPNTGYQSKIKISHGEIAGLHTNWLSLNNESATIIVNWLQLHYSISK